MPASTARGFGSMLLIATLLLCSTGFARAAAPSVYISGTTELKRMDSVAAGSAQLIAEELRRCGWYSIAEQPDGADYSISIEVLAFGSASKESQLGFGSDLSDLQRRLGQGDKVDQVKLLLVIDDRATCEPLCSRIVEGLESRKGTSAASENPAYYAGLNMSSDEFRRTSLGRAEYKALGDVLAVIYEALPLQGTIQALADDAVVIDMDGASGLRKGDDLTLLRDIPLRNAAGEPAWHEYRRIGLARVLDFQPGHCLCLILEGQGKLLEGDLARPLLAPVWFPDEADRKH